MNNATEEVELILDGPPPEGKGPGSLAIFAAIRRASSWYQTPDSGLRYFTAIKSSPLS